jgi:hypothetical protein
LPVFSIGRLDRERKKKFSEPIQDLVGPEPLEAMQRLVQRRKLLVRDAADLLHRLDVLLVERVDDLADFLALRGQADADRGEDAPPMSTLPDRAAAPEFDRQSVQRFPPPLQRL